MQPSMIGQGGIILVLNHRIVTSTGIEGYRYYLNLGREILDLLPLDSGKNDGQECLFNI